MPISRFAPDSSALADKLAALRALAPEAFTADGQLDWEAMRAAFGDAVEEGAPAFGLRWPGKRAAQRAAHTPVRKTMAPASGHGVDEASTRNFLIEGDNLDALKLLRKAYHKRVKMIYIDPPYNTGNDFVYKDDFAESAESFQAKTGAVDAEGARLVANPKSNGRFHSNWLDMIFPRLLLARELLRDDGVIFVSIDDNEVHNLRHVMDEVFGPENFVQVFVWRRRTGSNDAKQFFASTDHEYVIAYANSASFSFNGISKNLDRYRNPDNDPRGPWAPDNLTCNKTSRDRPTLFYPIQDPATGIVYECSPNRVWSFERQNMEALIREGKVIFPSKGNGTPKYKRHLAELRSESKPLSSWVNTSSSETYENAADVESANLVFPLNFVGTRHLRDLFDGQIFDYPKAPQMIAELIAQATDPADHALILDFFAGSGTTGEAVMRLNQEDGGRRQFILVQLPEPTDNPAFPTIADITAERLRRVSTRLKAESASAQLVLTDAAPPDLGFKVLHVAESFFRTWPDLAADEDESAYQRTLDAALDDPLRAGWTPDGVLTEIALQEGFPLDAAFAPAPEFTRNAVVRISHPSLTQSLYVCLDARLFAATADAARALGPHDVFFCFDAALGDELKLQLADACRVKTI